MQDDHTISGALAALSVSRRDFLRFCTAMAAALALPSESAAQIAETLSAAERLPVVWLHGQECTGDDESVLRASDPDISDILLNVISMEYMGTIMADAGHHAEARLEAALERYAGRYLVVQEGSVPTGANAYYCTVAGRTSEQILRQTAANAAGIICTGACASWGGWPASRPNPTGARPVYQIISDKPIINLTGCPHNGQVFAATIVHYLTFGRFPDTDALGRPLFAHGKRIHDNCERRAHFDAGQFVENWGDEGHRNGWCLYKMGCKGPQAFYNCPVIRWNDGTSWPVMSGHGCIACASFNFWDDMTPFYRRLPDVPLVPVEDTVDRLGAGLIAVALGAIGAHALGTAAWKRARRRRFAQEDPVVSGAAEPMPPAYPDLTEEERAARRDQDGEEGPQGSGGGTSG
ncbi:MAG: hydrogenase small subunit [Anaerolineae bacterium]|nr:hydrogenase small subunit [Anaerolineae bacterium]